MKEKMINKYTASVAIVVLVLIGLFLTYFAYNRNKEKTPYHFLVYPSAVSRDDNYYFDGKDKSFSSVDIQIIKRSGYGSDSRYDLYVDYKKLLCSTPGVIAKNPVIPCKPIAIGPIDFTDLPPIQWTQTLNKFALTQTPQEIYNL